MDKMTIYKVVEIEIDLAAERKRISKPRLYKKREQVLLLKMIDLFEEGNIQGMIETQAEWNKIEEYPIWEFLNEPYYQIVREMSQGEIWKRKETA